MGAAAWLPEAPPQESDEFSPVVLAAILAFSTVALCLLTVGQFTDIDPVGIALATATVLAGMARAGFDRGRAPARAPVPMLTTT